MAGSVVGRGGSEGWPGTDMGSPFWRGDPPPERSELQNPFPAHSLPEFRRGLQGTFGQEEAATAAPTVLRAVKRDPLNFLETPKRTRTCGAGRKDAAGFSWSLDPPDDGR